MQIDVLAAQPDLMQSPLSHSILKRAQDKGLLSVQTISLKEFGLGAHRQIDDYQYGGGAGMVLMVQPIFDAINTLQENGKYDEIIYLSPDGKLLDQPLANQLSLRNKILLICGHYKGIDERIREQLITMEISIGNYVLSGGELAAVVLVDTIGRLIPGVLNNEASALSDSFQDDLIAPPVYTRPAKFNDWEVPKILLSGNEAAIDQWRYEQSIKRTKKRRPDLNKD